jgi:hypothetical protein
VGVIHPLPQLFLNALNEGAKMTTKPELKKATIRARIRKGWTREKAETTPLLVVHRLKLNDVLKIEAEGLSLCSSAYVLGVTTPTLCAFIKSHNISWRGKRPNFKNFEKNPNSNLQKSIALGLHNMTIHKRMERLQCSYDEAVAIGNRKFTRITDELILKAIELKSGGLTLKATAKQLNCDAQWLSKRIKEFNQ